MILARCQYWLILSCKIWLDLSVLVYTTKYINTILTSMLLIGLGNLDNYIAWMIWSYNNKVCIQGFLVNYMWSPWWCLTSALLYPLYLISSEPLGLSTTLWLSRVITYITVNNTFVLMLYYIDIYSVLILITLNTIHLFWNLIKNSTITDNVFSFFYEMYI